MSCGVYCLSCGKDRIIRLWNPHRGLHIKTYKSHGREVRDVHVASYNPNSLDLLFKSLSVFLYLASIFFHDFSDRDNSELCSCGGDRQVFYWDVATGRVIWKFRGHDSDVNAVKFNEYSSVVVSAGYDRSLRAWDCRSHSTEPIQIIGTFSDSVMSVYLTKTEIIAGSVDGTVRTFDIRIGRSTGELLQEYKGHTCKSFKMDCCLTNTDALVAGGSEDGYIYFWDLVDARVVSSFRAHSLVVTSVSYHPKEECMITASVDGTIRVWKG